LNLLYYQTAAEVEQGWVQASKDVRDSMADMQARGAKLEYMRQAQNMPGFGYMRFERCICDYPCTDTPAEISVGNRELVLKIDSAVHGEKVGRFKVTKMRCWRVMTAAGDANCQGQLELSFEYLMHSGELQWITVVSHQAILMSMCLQSTVEELLRGKAGINVRKVSKHRC